MVENYIGLIAVKRKNCATFLAQVPPFSTKIKIGDLVMLEDDETPCTVLASTSVNREYSDDTLNLILSVAGYGMGTRIDDIPLRRVRTVYHAKEMKYPEEGDDNAEA